MGVAKLGSKVFRTLEAAPDVEELDISHSGLRSLAHLPVLSKLRTLYAYGNPLDSVVGIGNAARLHKLYVDAEDLSDVRKLLSLRTLVATTTKAKNLNFLAGLNKLSYVGIEAPLRSLAGIEKLPALGELVIVGASLNKLMSIVHPTLWKLIVKRSGLRSVPNLLTPKLILALFDENEIMRVGRMAAPVLRELTLSRNPLTHLVGLETLAKLNRLDIDGRRIKTIAKATDVHLRSLGKRLLLSVANARSETYNAFASKKRIV